MLQLRQDLAQREEKALDDDDETHVIHLVRLKKRLLQQEVCGTVLFGFVRV